MKKRHITACLFLAPAIIVMLIFMYIPIVQNFYYSLFNWSIYKPGKTFVGLKYFIELFQDKVFWTCLRNNTLYALISLVGQLGVGLVVAAILEAKFMRKHSGFFRTVFFIPSVMSFMVVGLLWQLFFNPNVGPFNDILKAMGMNTANLNILGNPGTAIFGVIFASQWMYFGYMAMLLIIGIQKVPDELYEAAEIDGANALQRFLHITIPNIKEKMNLLEEAMNDTEYEIEYSKDKDAKVGHKTADTSFFGYKTHIAMTPERIITAATITSGEKHDGKQLQKLVEKSQANGIDVEAVIGDGAYSEKENIEYCEEKNIKLASKLSKFVTHGNGKRNSNFEYNKDTGMYVCKAGHMAIRKAKQGIRNGVHGDSRAECYYFDVEKCKYCKFKEGCYKEGAKYKTYCIKIKDDIHIKHMDYMETNEFKELYAERYKIEAKNAELKSRFGYDTANACGKNGITIQGASALFLANIKRIIKLKEEKSQNNG